PKKNIDTGMGLERIAAILQGAASNYETDVMRSLLGVGERLCGKAYGANAGDDLSLRIIADHSRSVTFMIADGILPSNEGRGYVLRRLLRRAVMKAHLVGIEGSFLNEYVAEVVRLMGAAYPEIVDNYELVKRVVLSEEERFMATLRQGSAFLEAALEKTDGALLGGFEAFTLHDTYGFPIEITEEIAASEGIAVDHEEFARLMGEQKQRARAHAKDADKAWSTYGGIMSDIRSEVGKSQFVGYTQSVAEVHVLALVKDGERVAQLKAGESGRLVADATPFYAEKGGQVGDVGTMSAPGVEVRVTDTQEPESGLIAHTVEVESGSVHIGDALLAQIDVKARARTCRNHTATHILHGALRAVLGDHVKQAGSLVAPNRLRFDFTHFEAMTPAQIAEVERIANEQVMANLTVSAFETTLAQAREAGVIALFGEKYGNIVRVLDIEGFSRELCGGTHVGATSEIGFVKVVSESSVGANLRRIEAVTSYDALAYVNREEAELKEAAALLHVPLFDVSQRTGAQIRELKEKGSAQKQPKDTDAADVFSALAKEAFDAGYPLVVANVGEASVSGLRNGWDVVRAKLAAPGACVLGASNGGAPILLAAATPEAVAAGFDAAALIKAAAPLIQGGGGGNAAMAQAGGKNLAGLGAALDAARAQFA
ncbi:MAG: alanine--tRNA ligase, partial [Eggerthellaceae bacterium]|nr:alanine--tRNA ligase [Eggerthellaceae bacterium]